MNSAPLPGKQVNLSIDRLSAVPYYHQVKEAVKALIAGGELKPGDMLPSEFSLSEQLGISRLVVHRAYRELVMEGLLIRKRAVGTFVAPPAGRSSPVVGPLLSLTESVTRAGLDPQSRVLLQEVTPAAGAVSQALGLPEGAPVFHLVNLRLAGGLPLAIDEVFHPAERFPALAAMVWENRSVYAALDELYGAHPQEAVDVITAGAATREEARLLGLTHGAPVMRVQRTAADRQGRPVEYSHVVFHPERYQFVARVKRPV